MGWAGPEGMGPAITPRAGSGRQTSIRIQARVVESIGSVLVAHLGVRGQRNISGGLEKRYISAVFFVS